MSSSETKLKERQIKIGQNKELLKKRFGPYQAPNSDQVEMYKKLQEYFQEVAFLINELCPESIERSKAFTDLQSSKMFANASIALHYADK